MNRHLLSMYPVRLTHHSFHFQKLQQAVTGQHALDKAASAFINSKMERMVLRIVKTIQL
jgi:hypothetical protein